MIPKIGAWPERKKIDIRYSAANVNLYEMKYFNDKTLVSRESAKAIALWYKGKSWRLAKNSLRTLSLV